MATTPKPPFNTSGHAYIVASSRNGKLMPQGTVYAPVSLIPAPKDLEADEEWKSRSLGFITRIVDFKGDYEGHFFLSSSSLEVADDDSHLHWEGTVIPGPVVTSPYREDEWIVEICLEGDLDKVSTDD